MSCSEHCLYRSIVDDAHEGIVVLDAAGRISYANTRFAGMVGRSTTDLHERPLLDLADVEARPWPAPVEMHGGSRRQHELALRHASGKTVWALVSSSPLNGHRRATDRTLVVAVDVTQRLRFEERLRQQAQHDRLTGLPDRARLEHQLTRWLDEGRLPMSVIALDLDDLKRVNDAFGPVAGDRVLVAVADVLRQEVDAGASVARLASDEFAVLVAEPAEQAERRAWDLIERVRAAPPIALGVTASAGVATAGAGATVKGPDLLVAAHLAVQHAKASGKDRVARHSVSHGGGLPWVQRVHHALEHDGLVLHAQPIVEISSLEVVQQELLVRMLDEATGEVVMPDAFLPSAELYGLIREIDRWVTGRAVELAADGRMAQVNLSGRTIGDSLLLAQLERDLERTGADPSLLVFEITETLAIADIERARTFTGRLAELGCSIALDDFGTGFGTLVHLKELPISVIKIDRSFVAAAVSDANALRVVRAAVALAEQFAAITVAEGIEDRRTLQLMREVGVHLAQGYFWGRPAPIA